MAESAPCWGSALRPDLLLPTLLTNGPLRYIHQARAARRRRRCPGNSCVLDRCHLGFAFSLFLLLYSHAVMALPLSYPSSSLCSKPLMKGSV
ncbi:unnamed protein product [Gadus morhua 'NCC']